MPYNGIDRELLRVDGWQKVGLKEVSSFVWLTARRSKTATQGRQNRLSAVLGFMLMFPYYFASVSLGHMYGKDRKILFTLSETNQKPGAKILSLLPDVFLAIVYFGLSALVSILILLASPDALKILFQVIFWGLVFIGMFSFTRQPSMIFVRKGMRAVMRWNQEQKQNAPILQGPIMSADLDWEEGLQSVYRLIRSVVLEGEAIAAVPYSLMLAQSLRDEFGIEHVYLNGDKTLGMAGYLRDAD